MFQLRATVLSWRAFGSGLFSWLPRTAQPSVFGTEGAFRFVRLGHRAVDRAKCFVRRRSAAGRDRLSLRPCGDERHPPGQGRGGCCFRCHALRRQVVSRLPGQRARGFGLGAAAFAAKVSLRGLGTAERSARCRAPGVVVFDMPRSRAGRFARWLKTEGDGFGLAARAQGIDVSRAVGDVVAAQGGRGF